jgi:ATP-dependent Clp protease adaptor protein ClpS
MAEKEKPLDTNDTPTDGAGAKGGGGGSSAAVAKPKTSRKTSPKKKPPQPLPPWKVLLHNDDKNTQDFVVDTICELTPLKPQDALLRMIEAHKTGLALLLTTHKERAELYQEQFQSKGLVTTIEPAE